MFAALSYLMVKKYVESIKYFDKYFSEAAENCIFNHFCELPHVRVCLVKSGKTRRRYREA